MKNTKALNNHDADQSTEGATMAFWGNTATTPMRVMQSLAQENLKFWARRMHAYADWADAVSASGAPEQLLAAQKTFFAQLQQDYMKESATMAEVVSAATRQSREEHAP